MSMIGKTLGNFQCTALLGKGGMGEVYRAKDQKLGRDVAIKVLPEEFAKDADRVARFQREAKLLASLNHPNIAAIYGLEESDGTHFLVLELIEGDTLADRIKGGPVPVEEALKLALQIAEALEAAHEKGVIHRDLKPANIKVTPDVKVKVLDFGLAKAFAGDQVDMNLSNSPTLSDMATQQGIILGTAAYMSPEQARGKPVDKRTDIWAFGCVLYEMLTGKAAFQGEDVTEILAAVVKSGVNLDLLPANIHPRVQEVIIRCLQKDQKKRYGGIGDAQYELEQVLADPSGVFVQQASQAEPRTKSRQIVLWAPITAILIVIAGIIGWFLKTPEPRRAIPYDLELPEDQQFMDTRGPTFNVSPDGKQIVYCTTKGIYLKSVNELNAKLIPGSEELTENPFFSPDGKSVAYFSFSDQKLKKIAIGGGTPTVLCDAGGFQGASWDTDDFIVFSLADTGIMRVSAKGGMPEHIFLPKSTLPPNDPQILPDGQSVLYSEPSNQGRVMVKPINSEEPKELFAGWSARYLSSGYIVYIDGESNLSAVHFDLDRLEPVGEHVPMVSGVSKATISDTGTLTYTLQGPQGNNPQYSLVWVDREGKEDQLEAPPNQYDAPTISPDGKQIAVTIGGLGRNDIYIWNIARKTLNQLTREESNEIQPVWTPDSRRIIYFSDPDDFGIYRRQADGAGTVEKLISSATNRLFPYSISNDGKILLISELPTWANGDISMLTMEGDREKTVLLHDQYNEGEPQISPDGQWIAYSSDEMGDREVFVRSFPEVEKRKLQVSNGGGNCPLWSPHGDELFYLNADNDVMAVTVKTDQTLDLGTPKALFRSANLSWTFGKGYPWDIHPKGNRFLMIKPPAESYGAATAGGPRKITIVLNWDTELKERVPVE